MNHLSPSQRARAIGPRISVSSFSLHAELGEIRVPIETESGALEEFVLPSAGTMTMTEFPELVRARLGVRAVELCQIQLTDAPTRGVDKLATSLDQHAVAVTAIPIDIGNIANPDAARREAYLSEIRPWIDIAAQLGAPFARVNAGAPIGAPNSSRPALIASLRSLADYASSVNVSLLVENHGGPSSDPDWLAELLDTIGRDHLGLILDTGNFEPMLSAAEARHAGQPLDETTIDFEPIYEKIAKLAPLATLVHAKAYDVLDDGTCGPVDLRRSLNLIRDSGFDGPITIEYEGQSDDPWTCTVRMVSLVRQVFGRYLDESL